MVAPFAAGGDAIARILAEGLRSELGQPVIVENVGGADGTTTITRQWKPKSEFEARRVIRHCHSPAHAKATLMSGSDP